MTISTVTVNGKVYNKEDGCRLTDCCHTYSTFMDSDLCCKNCCEVVEFGEGDGSEKIEVGRA